MSSIFVSILYLQYYMPIFMCMLPCYHDFVYVLRYGKSCFGLLVSCLPTQNKSNNSLHRLTINLFIPTNSCMYVYRSFVLTSHSCTTLHLTGFIDRFIRNVMYTDVILAATFGTLSYRRLSEISRHCCNPCVLKFV